LGEGLPQKPVFIPSRLRLLEARLAGVACKDKRHCSVHRPSPNPLPGGEGNQENQPHPPGEYKWKTET